MRYCSPLILLLLALSGAAPAEPPVPLLVGNNPLVLADFENGSYDGWTLEGNCWGKEPASDALFPGKITGFQGKRFLCSLDAKTGNAATGRAVSREFTVANPFLSFRVGGGNFPSETYVALLVEGKEAVSVTGDDSPELNLTVWDLRKYAGKKAQIEVVDRSVSPKRGYIMADNFHFWNDRPYRLARKKTTQWRVSQQTSHGAFEGSILYPVPPDDPGQRILSSRVVLTDDRGTRTAPIVQDTKPLQQPVYALEVKESGSFSVRAEVDVTFYDCSLVADDEAPAPEPLDPAMKTLALNDEFATSQEREWYRGWMQSESLLRRAGETDSELAYRALVYMHRNFVYKIPDDLPEYKEAVRAEGDFGSWKYRIATKSGECWRLSDIYARILRMNGIPVRVLSGNHVGKNSGHHVRPLVWLANVGWVPMEPTIVVNGKNMPPDPWFGNWGGTMLSGNKNLWFSVPLAAGNFTIGTFDTLWLVPRRGRPESVSAFSSEPLR